MRLSGRLSKMAKLYGKAVIAFGVNCAITAPFFIGGVSMSISAQQKPSAFILAAPLPDFRHGSG